METRSQKQRREEQIQQEHRNQRREEQIQQEHRNQKREQQEHGNQQEQTETVTTNFRMTSISVPKFRKTTEPEPLIPYKKKPDIVHFATLCFDQNSHKMPKERKVGRWYFGGLGSAGAACCTHPLDLLKVHLQTQQSGNIGLWRMGVKVVKGDGILGLYNGLSASLLRQLTYSLTRFGIYESVKNKYLKPGDVMPFYQKVLLGGVAGCIGGVAGTPGDMVNVRMQNDMKLPKEQRRNYKHAVDGLIRVAREEGMVKLMNGCTMASSRATLVTIGQLSCYDQFKQLLLTLPFFKDNIITHFTASFMAGATATLITMPLDVMKTRVMNAPPGTYSSLTECAKDIGKNGPQGFFKGFFPAFVRLGPQTILTFIFLEQLRLNFGVTVIDED